MYNQSPTPAITIEHLVWGLWERCLTNARMLDSAPAGPIEDLIRGTRAIIADYGYSRRDSDYLLFGIYTRIHWDWQEHTDRVFEALLEFELDDFFNAHFKVKAN